MSPVTEALPTPEELRPVTELTTRVLDQLNRMLLGRVELHRMVLIGILSRGHLLLEGLPGLGKTALIKALSDVLRLDFKRIQFTPDLMPSDILGTHILQETAERRREMIFQPGPVFTNILLADEINRASPKTQSAMLETMQEHAVTLLGTTRKLPEPFFVLASQNPIELEGTYPLPEAQLDRFLFKLMVENVAVDVLDDIITTRRHGHPPAPAWTMTAEQLAQAMAMVERIYLPRPVSRYIARLVAATHPNAAEATADVTQYVAYGASPRAAIGIAEAARSHALLAGRPTVGFEDVRAVVPAVLNHRLILNYKARFDRKDAFHVVRGALAALSESGLNLPADVRIAEGRA
jgi:MoxR-like ATPase